MFTLDLDAFQLALISPDHEMLDKIEAAKGRNTMVPLAFDILEATRQKMTDLGRDTRIFKQDTGNKADIFISPAIPVFTTCSFPHIFSDKCSVSFRIS